MEDRFAYSLQYTDETSDDFEVKAIIAQYQLDHLGVKVSGCNEALRTGRKDNINDPSDFTEEQFFEYIQRFDISSNGDIIDIRNFCRRFNCHDMVDLALAVDAFGYSEKDHDHSQLDDVSLSVVGEETTFGRSTIDETVFSGQSQSHVVEGNGNQCEDEMKNIAENMFLTPQEIASFELGVTTIQANESPLKSFARGMVANRSRGEKRLYAAETSIYLAAKRHDIPIKEQKTLQDLIRGSRYDDQRAEVFTAGYRHGLVPPKVLQSAKDDVESAESSQSKRLSAELDEDKSNPNDCDSDEHNQPKKRRVGDTVQSPTTCGESPDEAAVPVNETMSADMGDAAIQS